MTEPTKPAFCPPPGACDTHIHIYDPALPLAPTAVANPPHGSVADYRVLQERLGLDRVVVVQPSAYGTDNRATVDAVASFGLDTARGVAVVDADTPDAELARLTRAGTVGARFLMLPGGAIGWEQLDRIAARVTEHGWHVQLQLDGRSLPDRMSQIARWPGRIVIDHVGKFIKPVPVDHPGFHCLLDLLETGRVWVKLSAPYEVSERGPPAYEDVGVLARALIEAAPERMLWASNWPHPSAQHDPPDDAQLLSLLDGWVEDAAIRDQILVANPALLYGFNGSGR
ncbi:amidohydrolase family protein [Pararhodobacter sp. SW119]|uniref:amidohydrolase family protein n=1 Tax=Pararhodobacter sp. SW119 TaxID=2780075 RepID=UPI001ADF82D0|nr:amidohydrolase family protein [Pararhodobacter sp. SW119]